MKTAVILGTRPELNPVEECWRQTKDIVQANCIYPTFGAMVEEISNTLRAKKFRLNMVAYIC